MRSKCLIGLFAFAVTLLLSSCSSLSPSRTGSADGSQAEDADGTITVGNSLTIQDIDSRLKLLNNLDTLSADGLYYAAWAMGDAEPYENSDGDTVDLYDAQLYLLLMECKSAQDAQSNIDTWLETGRNNYDILSEEEAVCNGQTYTLITYNCVSKDNPYARGISAFGAFSNSAVCIELTCREQFEDDLRSILTDFLEHCTITVSD